MATATVFSSRTAQTRAQLAAAGGVRGQIVALLGYNSVGDGGGALYYWSSSSAAADDHAEVIAPTGYTRGRWIRVDIGTPRIANVKHFGAVGTSLVNATTAVIAAIASLGATGGDVYFPPGTEDAPAYYPISTTLDIGGASFKQAINLVGGGSHTATILIWNGAVGGTLMRVRNEQCGSIRNLYLSGNTIADHCLQFTHRLGDAGIVTNWKVECCAFANAKLHNVLVGEPTGTTYGDCSAITFDNCVWFGSGAGVETTSHFRQRATGTFSTMFLNCRFYGGLAASGLEEGSPLYHISMLTGTAIVLGGLFDVPGVSAVHLDAAAAVDLPSITITGVENQGNTESLFLMTELGVFAGTSTATAANSLTDSSLTMTTNQYASGYALVSSAGVVYDIVSNTGTSFVLSAFGATPASGAFKVVRGGQANYRCSVITDCSADNIVDPHSAVSIYWDFGSQGGLVLDGCRFQGNVEIDHPDARVFSHGTTFDPGAGFTGLNKDRVAGTWTVDGAFHMRQPDLQSYASNAAAISGGLSKNDLYRTSGGAVMVVI